MAEKSSITRVGTYEPFELQVSRGQIAYHRAISVFGYNADVDQTEESVWPDGGVVPFLAAATIMTVSSTSAADDAAPPGTGARVVFVDGLDANYKEISEYVALNGQLPVSTVNAYLHINRLTVVEVGSGQTNAGIINIGTGLVTLGTPAVLYNLIAAGFNGSTTGDYTVPAGHTAYLTVGIFTVGQPGGSNEVTGRLSATTANGIRQIVAVVAINNGSVQYDFSYPLRIPEKTTLGATAIGKSNNNAVSVMFNMVLIQNAEL